MKIKTVLGAALLLTLGVQATFAQVTYRVYATREGLVGARTANGHIIQSRDHFVALPASSALNANDSTYTYTVNLSNPANGRSVNNVPVWDVGPWNIKDNYWAAHRTEFATLARGTPEAQAAYLNGFNGGLDDSGRAVQNPAGIDLADGTFWDDLGMAGNGYIDVTYNWVKGTIIDNSNAGFTASANWTTATSATQKYGADYRYRSTAAASDPGTWTVNLANNGNYYVYAWWSAGSNRSATAPYVVYHAGGSTTVNANQQANGGQWNKLGLWNMNAGSNQVKLSCWTTTGFIVLADAVNWR